jgi:hypothetical protein
VLVDSWGDVPVGRWPGHQPASACPSWLSSDRLRVTPPSSGRKSEKFGPMIYTPKIYKLSIALYIYAHIYRNRSFPFWESYQVGGGERRNVPKLGAVCEPLGPQLRSPPPLRTDHEAPLSSLHVAFSSFTFLGGGKGAEQGDRGWSGGRGLVSKHGCNLRKSPGRLEAGGPPGAGRPLTWGRREGR